MAFDKWGKMVGELHACVEGRMGTTAIKSDESVAEVEKKFAIQASTGTKNQVALATDSLKKAEERLDKAIDNVTGPWATVIQGTVTGFTQALPHIIAGVLPAVLAASNPMTTVGVLASGAPKTNDPAYIVALEIRDIVTLFYESLGGENRPMDWTKFNEQPKEEGKPVQTGTGFLIGTWNGYKTKVVVTNTEPNKKLITALDALIRVDLQLQSFSQPSKSNNFAAYNYYSKSSKSTEQS
jgi:hypothetical protein